MREALARFPTPRSLPCSPSVLGRYEVPLPIGPPQRTYPPHGFIAVHAFTDYAWDFLAAAQHPERLKELV
jgi:hypothetical protein